MSAWFPFCPRPPRWRVDWDAIDGAFPWVRALAGCPQDPLYHAEGDVWTHTRMVCEALVELPGFRARAPAERLVLFAAALLHDVAKPMRTALEGDRLTARGHAWRGAIEARRLLWEMDAPFAAREQVCALVRWHQHPFFLIEREDPRRQAIEISQTARCDLLALLAEADAPGRIGAGRERLLENVALFAAYCREQGCLEGPYAFPSDHARFLYFHRPERDPEYAAFDDTRCEVVVMSGLPGAGKDHWLREHVPDLPVVSLDALRAELDVDPADDQGAVVRAARERAREYLRRGEPFAWNATNVSRRTREACVGLCAAYRARVRLVYIETPEERLRAQNCARPSPVPDQVIDRLLELWEVPDLTEAQQVEHVHVDGPLQNSKTVSHSALATWYPSRTER